LPRNEAETFERLHHLIDTRRRNEEVALDVGFSWRPTNARDVLGDEFKVFELALRRPPRILSEWRVDLGRLAATLISTERESTARVVPFAK